MSLATRYVVLVIGVGLRGGGELGGALGIIYTENLYRTHRLGSANPVYVFQQCWPSLSSLPVRDGVHSYRFIATSLHIAILQQDCLMLVSFLWLSKSCTLSSKNTLGTMLFPTPHHIWYGPAYDMVDLGLCQTV